jgi:peroxiredoxin
MISSSIRIAPMLLSTALVLVAASGCGAAGGGGAQSALVGTAAPSFKAEPIGGDGAKSLEEAKGKVVILDFWGTFCGPCKKSFPKYQGLVDQFGGDVTVLAVSIDEADNADEVKKTKERINDFVKETGVKFAIVWDKDHAIVKQYGVTQMPTSFIIDKTGTVKFVHAAYKDDEDAKIAEEVKGLIGK